MSSISWKVISRGVNNDTEYLATSLSFAMASDKEDWATAILIYRSLKQQDKNSVILSSWMLPVAQNTNDHKFILELAGELQKHKKPDMHASLLQSVINSYVKSGDTAGALEKLDLAITSNKKEAIELAALRLKVVKESDKEKESDKDKKVVNENVGAANTPIKKGRLGAKRTRDANDTNKKAGDDDASASASASASAKPIPTFKRKSKHVKH